MSVQEKNLTAIANAIREREGSTGPIPAGDFAARILALPGGSGTEGFAVPLVVTVEQGAAVTVVQGDTTITGTSGAGGTVTLILTAPGEWTVTASLNGKQKETTVTVGNGYEAVLRMSSNLPEGVTLPEGYVELEYIDNPNLGSISRNAYFTMRGTSYAFDIEVPEGAKGTLMGRVRQVQYYSGSKGTVSGTQLAISRSGDIVTVALYGRTQTSNSGSMLLNTLCIFEMQKTRLKIETDYNTYLSVNDEEQTFSHPAYATGNSAPPQGSLFALSRFYQYDTAGTTTDTDFLHTKLYSMTVGTNKNYWAPCKNPEGAVGLYDTANNKFYSSSAAAKPFVAGPVV